MLKKILKESLLAAGCTQPLQQAVFTDWLQPNISLTFSFWFTSSEFKFYMLMRDGIIS